jgi:hypothetical protein
MKHENIVYVICEFIILMSDDCETKILDSDSDLHTTHPHKQL